jgi:hypothetical protein
MFGTTEYFFPAWLELGTSHIPPLQVSLQVAAMTRPRCSRASIGNPLVDTDTVAFLLLQSMTKDLTCRIFVATFPPLWQDEKRSPKKKQ